MNNRRGPNLAPRLVTLLFDFRPVLRNRSAMAYAIIYGIHPLEMNALRGWGVAFLGFVTTRTEASAPLLLPTAALTALGVHATRD